MKYIKKFQKKHGLYPDGIIGKNTLHKMMCVFNIQSKIALAHFLGQVAAETGNFEYGVENLNYSARRLRQVFGRYFTYDESLEYARKPELIANRVYDDRNPHRINKLGNVYDGDGWKFRGRGALQITGRNTYQDFANYIGDPQVMTNPDIVEKKYYWKTALLFFKKREIWHVAKDVTYPTIRKVTKLVNGGYNGIDHREQLTYHFYHLLERVIYEV